MKTNDELITIWNELPAQERIAAYYELKKVAPDVVAGIREENALTAASIELIKSNVLARKELIKFEIQEAGIKAALTKNEETLANKRLELINLENRKREQAPARIIQQRAINNLIPPHRQSINRKRTPLHR